MKPIIVNLDMDGVLCNFSQHFNDVTGFNNRVPKEYHIHKLKMIGTDFYHHIPQYNNTNDLVNFVVEVFGGYNICSAPMVEDWDNSVKNKLLWIADNLIIPPTNIYFTLDKYNHATSRSILIDDHSKNITEFIDHGGIGIDFKNGIDSYDELLTKLLTIKGTIIRD